MSNQLSVRIGARVSGGALALVMAVVGPAHAQVPLSEVPLMLVPSVPARIEGMPRELPRARGPGLRQSMELARAAVEACAAKGARVSVLVTDSVGVPVVMLSGDGAGERSQLITSTKAATVIKYGLSSEEVWRKAKADTKLAAELKANPNIGVPRGGALPLMKGGELLGAIAVSGATGIDEECAKAAVSKVPLQ